MSKLVYGVGDSFSLNYDKWYWTEIGKTRNYREYQMWVDMLRRCYSLKEKQRKPTYRESIASDYFLSYDNFRAWLDQQPCYQTYEDYVLDKDILIKDNKVYSEDTCLIVPREVNLLFTNRKSTRNVCIGVYHHKGSKPYRSTFNDGTKTRHLGIFNTVDQAFEAYKTVKEKKIVEIANKYKEVLGDKAYDAILKYKVEITD